MSGLNVVNVSGRLTAPASQGYTAKEVPYCYFRLAIDDYKSTIFVDVSVYGQQYHKCTELGKGQRVIVDGRLTQSEWESEGRRHSKLRIIANNVHFIDWPSKAAQEGDDGEKAF